MKVVESKRKKYTFIKLLFIIMYNFSSSIILSVLLLCFYGHVISASHDNIFSLTANSSRYSILPLPWLEVQYLSTPVITKDFGEICYGVHYLQDGSTILQMISSGNFQSINNISFPFQFSLQGFFTINTDYLFLSILPLHIADRSSLYFYRIPHSTLIPENLNSFTCSNTSIPYILPVPSSNTDLLVQCDSQLTNSQTSPVYYLSSDDNIIYPITSDPTLQQIHFAIWQSPIEIILEYTDESFQGSLARVETCYPPRCKSPRFSIPFIISVDPNLSVDSFHGGLDNRGNLYVWADAFPNAAMITNVSTKFVPVHSDIFLSGVYQVAEANEPSSVINGNDGIGWVFINANINPKVYEFSLYYANSVHFDDSGYIAPSDLYLISVINPSLPHLNFSCFSKSPSNSIGFLFPICFGSDSKLYLFRLSFAEFLLPPSQQNSIYIPIGELTPEGFCNNFSPPVSLNDDCGTMAVVCKAHTVNGYNNYLFLIFPAELGYGVEVEMLNLYKISNISDPDYHIMAIQSSQRGQLNYAWLNVYSQKTSEPFWVVIETNKCNSSSIAST